MFGAVAACRAKHRRSAVRAEAPPCGGSQNLQIPVLNGARPAGFGTRTFGSVDRVGQSFGNWCRHLRKNWKPAAARAILRIAKPIKPAANNRKRTTIFRNPPAPLRRQRTAESTNHADKSPNPCHSGCEVAESEDNKNRTNTNRGTPPAQVLQASKNTLRPTEPIAGKKRGPGD